MLINNFNIGSDKYVYLSSYLNCPLLLQYIRQYLLVLDHSMPCDPYTIVRNGKTKVVTSLRYYRLSKAAQHLPLVHRDYLYCDDVVDNQDGDDNTNEVHDGEDLDCDACLDDHNDNDDNDDDDLH